MPCGYVYTYTYFADIDPITIMRCVDNRSTLTSTTY